MEYTLEIYRTLEWKDFEEDQQLLNDAINISRIYANQVTSYAIQYYYSDIHINDYGVNLILTSKNQSTIDRYHETVNNFEENLANAIIFNLQANLRSREDNETTRTYFTITDNAREGFKKEVCKSIVPSCKNIFTSSITYTDDDIEKEQECLEKVTSALLDLFAKNQTILLSGINEEYKNALSLEEFSTEWNRQYNEIVNQYPDRVRGKAYLWYNENSRSYYVKYEELWNVEFEYIGQDREFISITNNILPILKEYVDNILYDQVELSTITKYTKQTTELQKLLNKEYVFSLLDPVIEENLNKNNIYSGTLYNQCISHIKTLNFVQNEIDYIKRGWEIREFVVKNADIILEKYKQDFIQQKIAVDKDIFIKEVEKITWDNGFSNLGGNIDPFTPHITKNDYYEEYADFVNNYDLFENVDNNFLEAVKDQIKNEDFDISLDTKYIWSMIGASVLTAVLIKNNITGLAGVSITALITYPKIAESAEQEIDNIKKNKEKYFTFTVIGNEEYKYKIKIVQNNIITIVDKDNYIYTATSSWSLEIGNEYSYIVEYEKDKKQYKGTIPKNNTNTITINFNKDTTENDKNHLEELKENISNEIKIYYNTIVSNQIHTEDDFSSNDFKDGCNLIINTKFGEKFNQLSTNDRSDIEKYKNEEIEKYCQEFNKYFEIANKLSEETKNDAEKIITEKLKTNINDEISKNNGIGKTSDIKDRTKTDIKNNEISRRILDEIANQVSNPSIEPFIETEIEKCMPEAEKETKTISVKIKVFENASYKYTIKEKS